MSDQAAPVGTERRGSGASAWTISSSWARRICAVSWERMLVITTTSGRIGHWIKMHQFLARFSEPVSFALTRSLVDFITITSESRFSVHTGHSRYLQRNRYV